jgi:hypothetical protein
MAPFDGSGRAVTRRIGVAVVEVISTLEAALERAGQLLDDNYANVATMARATA